jgi:hypothetical protein
MFDEKTKLLVKEQNFLYTLPQFSLSAGVLEGTPQTFLLSTYRNKVGLVVFCTEQGNPFYYQFFMVIATGCKITAVTCAHCGARMV